MQMEWTISKIAEMVAYDLPQSVVQRIRVAMFGKIIGKSKEKLEDRIKYLENAVAIIAGQLGVVI